MTRRKKPQMINDMVQLTMAAPVVVAERMTRMAFAGASPSARDRKEMTRMSSEKVDAFTELWSTTATQMMRANIDLSADLMRLAWSPWYKAGGLMNAATARYSDAATDSVKGSLVPMRRRAVANAKRLGRKGRA